MRLACCQTDILWENKSANHAKVRSMVSAANLPKDTLLLLPELFAVGFSMNISEIDDTRSRQTQRFLSELAKEFSIYVCGGVAMSCEGKGRNECAIYNPAGEEISRYCKMQPFTLAGEARHYAAGPDVSTYAWKDFTVAPFICYDLRFPELFRVAARRGAQLITVIANWTNRRDNHWITLLRARAIENQAYVAGVNRIGSDPSFGYSGNSMIIDPHGEIIVEAGGKEGIISAEINVEAVNNWRRDFPALNDIRSEFFA
ncbi:MAG TPA: carbon-nitrogen family hydrolase [Planctomycetota bacterium]|nr:carbon-nitrogen family hydrolase [Planctomycetota bacterium]